MPRGEQGGSRSSARKVNAKVKAQRALELRKACLSYDAIARMPTDRNHPEGTPGYQPLYANRSGARKAVQRELALRARQTDETAHEVLGLELARLDELQASHWMLAIKQDADPKSTELVLKIMERRTRYLGIDFADGLDERYLQVQEHEARRTLAAFEQAMADVGYDRDEVMEVLARVDHHLNAPGEPDETGSGEA